MSKVFNMISGGGENKTERTGLLYGLGYEESGMPVEYQTNGTLSHGHLFPSNMATIGGTASYSYVRLGPMSFEGMASINAVISCSVSNGTRRTVLYAVNSDKTGADTCRSWNTNLLDVISVKQRSDGDLQPILEHVVAINVSNLQSGEYYLYCGIDDAGESWSNPRTGQLYGINYDPIT